MAGHRGFVVVAALVVSAACSPVEPAPTPPVARWQPGLTYATERAPNPRGLLDRRGLIHAHSVYSHDACDGEPVKDGVRDEVCFDDFRRGLCQSKHDFVMLTDHRESFGDTEFPEVLLHREDRGDELVVRAGEPVASWAACDDGARALILAGNEAGMMPVGLERHPVPTEQRGALYGTRSAENIAVLKDNGAVVLVPHTEDFTADELIELPLDGFEMFNLHANSFLAAGTVLELLLRVRDGDPGVSHPDLSALYILSEDPRYLDTWARVVARGARRVTTMGTDCHRNSFPALLSDGERVDSYRRMMLWLSNHLLVRPDEDGGWDDRHLKDALRAGRLYGAFEVLGYPVGFDSYAEAAGGAVEMGDEVALSDAPELVVARPAVKDLDPDRAPPELSLVLYRATEEGWQEVARSDEDELRFSPTEPGAYRAEVRMLPLHLAGFLGDDEALLLEGDRVWIYGNPIYVTD